MSHDDNLWDDHTDLMTFEVRRGNTTVCSVWTNSVCNALRKQAGWAKLQEARATAVRHWTERVWYSSKSIAPLLNIPENVACARAASRTNPEKVVMMMMSFICSCRNKK
jgi:hypothetical protein